MLHCPCHLWAGITWSQSDNLCLYLADVYCCSLNCAAHRTSKDSIRSLVKPKLRPNRKLKYKTIRFSKSMRLELDVCATTPDFWICNKTMCQSVCTRECVGWLIGYNGELNLSCHLNLEALHFYKPANEV